MAERLEIIITATDKASKVLGNVGNASKKLFGGVVKLGAVGVGGLAAGLGGAVATALDAELSFAKLNQIIESTGGVAGITTDEAQALADSLARVTRFSDEQIESGESMLLTFTNIGEDVFPRATETMLNMGETFGNVDGAAIQLGKALNDPVAGIGALKEVGVSFTEEQMEMVTAMVESGDIMGAQTVILDELEKEFGGVARAAGDTLSGKLTILKNRFFDIVQTVGLQLIPVISRFVDRAILPALEAVGDFVGIFVELYNIAQQFGFDSPQFFLALARAFGPDVMGQVKSFIDIFAKVRDALVGFIQDAVIPFVQKHAPAFKNILIALGAVIVGATVLGGILSLIGALAALANPITLIIAAIALLVMAWTEDWGGIRTYITEKVWPAVKPIFEEIKDWLETTIPKAIDWLKDKWETVLLPALLSVATLWDTTIKPALQNLYDFLQEFIPKAVDWLKDKWDTVLVPALQTLVDLWNDTVKPALNDLIGFFYDNIPLAIDALKGVWDTILVPLFNGLVLLWHENVQPALQALWDFLQEHIPAGIDWLKDKWDTVLIPVLQALVDFWNTTVKPALQNLYDFFQIFIPAAWNALKSVYDSVLKPIWDALVLFWYETLQPVLQELYDFFQQHIPAAWDALKTAWDAVKSNVIDPLIAAFGEARDTIAEVVGAIGDVIDKFGEFWESIEGGVVGDVIGAISGIDLNPFQLGGLKRAGQIGRVNELGAEGFLPMQSQGLVIPHDIFRELKRGQQQNFYNLTINSNAGWENVASDFHLMKTLAGA